MESPALVISDRMYVLGGFYTSNLQASRRMDVFDAATSTWTQLADLPTAVTHAGFATDNDTIWLAGGFVGNNPGVATAQVWAYSVVLNQWSALPALPDVRGGGGLANIGRKLHFFGGVLADRDTDSDSHWMLDLDALSAGWVPCAPFPQPRNHFGTARMGQTFLALGGQNRHDTSPADVAHVHAYDTTTDAWTQLAPLPFARSHFEPSVLVSGTQVLIAGGRASGLGLAILPDIHVYDASTGLTTSLDPLPKARLAPIAQRLGQELHVLGGGGQGLVPQMDHYSRPWSTGPAVSFRINSGGDGLTSATGNAWCPDQGFVGGMAYSNPNAAVQGTVDPQLYRTERTGSAAQPDRFSYKLALPPGLYRVRLHFAEIYWGATGGPPGAPGQRVFDVELEGALALDNYDIFARVGAEVAEVLPFDVSVVDGGLDVKLLASVNKPKLSGLEVAPLPGGSFWTTCTGTPNSTGAVASLAFVGSTSVSDDFFELVSTGLPAGQPAIFAMGSNEAHMPFAAGFLCIQPPVFRLAPPLTTGGDGTVRYQLHPGLPGPAAGVLPGTSWHFQLFYRDLFAGADNLSSGLFVHFLP